MDINAAISRNGALHCFCEQNVEEKGFPKDYLYDFTSIVVEEYLKAFTKIADNDAETKILVPICKDYDDGYWLQQYYNELVVIMSFFARNFFIWVAKQLKFVSHTRETVILMTSVFYITYINYGLIYFLASIDTRKSKLPIVANFFNGLYPDFNAFWFNDIGMTITSIMKFNMIWPILEFLILFCIRFVGRMWDQRSLIPFNPKKTNCKSI